MKRKSTQIHVFQLLLVVLLGFLTLTMIVPLLHILAKSLSAPEQSIKMKGLEVFPKNFDLINYRIVFSHPILMASLWNSIYVTVIGTV